MAESSTGKSASIDKEIMDYAVELFLESLPKISEMNVSEKQEKKN